MATPKKHELKSTSAIKPAAEKQKKEVGANIKIEAAKHITHENVVPQAKPNLVTRGNLCYLRSPSSPSMCLADWSTPHAQLLRPQRGSPTAGCPEGRNSVHGRILQQA